MTILNAFRSQRSLLPLRNTSDDLYRSALVHIRVDMLSRGSPSDMAIIYTLSAGERTMWSSTDAQDKALGRAAHVDLTASDLAMSEIQRVSPLF